MINALLILFIVLILITLRLNGEILAFYFLLLYEFTWRKKALYSLYRIYLSVLYTFAMNHQS